VKKYSREVVGEADNGVVAMSWTKAGDVALYAGDPGGEPDEAETGPEAGKNERMPFENRKDHMRNENCHFSRTDKH
jgi:hypothetical protein